MEIEMTIQSGNIHNILRTYNDQIKKGKLSALSSSESKTKELDKVTFSPEAKRVMFVSGLVSDKKISSEDIEEYLDNKNIDFSKISDKELEDIKSDILANI
jgi:hypothetical protein